MPKYPYEKLTAAGWERYMCEPRVVVPPTTGAVKPPHQRHRERERLLKNMNSRYRRYPKYFTPKQLVGGFTSTDVNQFFENKLQAIQLNREDYGTLWEIDHILPLSMFDLSKARHQLLAFSLHNCQPLGKVENQTKRDSHPTDQKLFDALSSLAEKVEGQKLTVDDPIWSELKLMTSEF